MNKEAALKKVIYIGAPKCFLLDLACRHINEAFGGFNTFVVGSCLQKPDWRDVDIRLILDDDQFEREFPAADLSRWEHDAKWLIVTSSISLWLQQQTGLPVDFQIQPMTGANARHTGQRQAIGLKIEKAQVKQ